MQRILIKLLEQQTQEEKKETTLPFEEVMNELSNTIKKDARRKVCPNCHELGHDKASNKCKLNIELDNKNREKIKHYILSNEECNDYKLANDLGINITKYKMKSYREQKTTDDLLKYIVLFLL